MKNSRSSDNWLYKILSRIFPFISWFKDYNFSHFRIDFISGLTVALVLIPQSMAYAQLAGLPPYYGLYAAFIPPLIAALFGSSRQLATGPVAVVSLMTATALEPLATAGSEGFIQYAILLALMVGLFQFLLGILRLGLVVNFLSHPVVNGFTNAAAIIIATSQLSKIFGVYVQKGDHHYVTIYRVIEAAFDYTHIPTLLMAILGFAIMIGIRKWNPRLPNVLIAVVITTLLSWMTGFEKNYKTATSCVQSQETVSLIERYNDLHDKMNERVDDRISLSRKLEKSIEEHGEKSTEVIDLQHDLAIIELDIKNIKEKIAKARTKLRHITFRIYEDKDGDYIFCNADHPPENIKVEEGIWHLNVGNDKLDISSMTFSSGGAVVGKIPAGLPSFETPDLDLRIMAKLLPMAIIISLLGFMEAISIAKAMAAKTGQRLDPNQELIGQGLANIIGCLSKSYAVSGSFSRSAVNIQAGAVSGLSSVFSSLVVMITLLFFTQFLYHLPQAILATIIMMAVFGLINVSGFIHAWKANRFDGIISIITFVTTLFFAPHLDRGIMIGVVLSIAYYLFSGMKPNIALLSKHPDGTWRNKDRFGLQQCKHIAILRYNGSLFFANVSFLERSINDIVSSMPELRHIILVANGINELDASGENMLSTIVERLRESGIEFSISGANDQVMDTMKRTYLYYKIGENNMYRTIHKALEKIHSSAHEVSDEKICPLINVVYVSDNEKHALQKENK